ncbi:MAG: NAD-dependent epimerase/dehydratase family protein [Sedimentisphaerales bacterium]|nr:NAD-dependent epimerase/dehydratase family protein [Sedimentisphaerales bacterium]
MSKRVVITGGTGFIGAALSRSLADAGYEVVVLSGTSGRQLVGSAWRFGHHHGCKFETSESDHSHRQVG